MAELKTRKTDASVQKYLDSLDAGRRTDCEQLCTIMGSITKSEPAMWGTSIVGFGSYCYRNESGRENDWFLTGFSSRKQAISVYMLAGFEGRDELMSKLGTYKMGQSCLYIKSLEDIHVPTLKTLIRESIKGIRAMNKEAR